MKLKQPNPDLLYQCCMRPIYIVPHEIFERDKDFKSTAVGTGAWMVAELKTNQQVVTKPNPDYYEKGIANSSLRSIARVLSLEPSLI